MERVKSLKRNSLGDEKTNDFSLLAIENYLLILNKIPTGKITEKCVALKS